MLESTDLSVFIGKWDFKNVISTSRQLSRLLPESLWNPQFLIEVDLDLSTSRNAFQTKNYWDMGSSFLPKISWWSPARPLLLFLLLFLNFLDFIKIGTSSTAVGEWLFCWGRCFWAALFWTCLGRIGVFGWVGRVWGIVWSGIQVRSRWGSCGIGWICCGICWYWGLILNFHNNHIFIVNFFRWVIAPCWFSSILFRLRFSWIMFLLIAYFNPILFLWFSNSHPHIPTDKSPARCYLLSLF